MNKIWIFALVLWSIIGGACSDDVSSAHNESGNSSSAGVSTPCAKRRNAKRKKSVTFRALLFILL